MLSKPRSWGDKQADCQAPGRACLCWSCYWPVVRQSSTDIEFGARRWYYNSWTLPHGFFICFTHSCWEVPTMSQEQLGILQQAFLTKLWLMFTWLARGRYSLCRPFHLRLFTARLRLEGLALSLAVMKKHLRACSTNRYMKMAGDKVFFHPDLMIQHQSKHLKLVAMPARGMMCLQNDTNQAWLQPCQQPLVHCALTQQPLQMEELQVSPPPKTHQRTQRQVKQHTLPGQSCKRIQQTKVSQQTYRQRMQIRKGTNQAKVPQQTHNQKLQQQRNQVSIWEATTGRFLVYTSILQAK